jgi:NAD(P)-dependent dehydrogenase (short-subunit alcohol dehydrogenase family)
VTITAPIPTALPHPVPTAIPRGAAELAASFDFRGRRALIVGAGQGVGPTIAAALTAAGAAVVTDNPTARPVDIVVAAVEAAGREPLAALGRAFRLVDGIRSLLSAGASIVYVYVTQPGGGDPAALAALAAGLTGLTRALATELGPQGVRVNLVSADPAAAVRAEQIAAVVLFLASAEARGITGETVVAAGGR